METLGSLGDLLAMELVRSSILRWGWGCGEGPKPRDEGSGGGPGLEERPSGKTELEKGYAGATSTIPGWNVSEVTFTI